MSRVEHAFVTEIAADILGYHLWEIKSKNYVFSRVKSAENCDFVLRAPVAPAEYIIATCINDSLEKVGHTSQKSKSSEFFLSNEVYYFPKNTKSTVRFKQSFDIVHFCKNTTRNNHFAQVCTQPFIRKDEIAVHLMMSLVLVLNSKQDVSAEFINNLGETLDTHLYQSIYTKNHLTSDAASVLNLNQLKRAQSMLLSKAKHKVTMSQIAEECGLSTNYFSSTFKNTTGKSPSLWFLEQRVGEAKKLLLTTELLLSDIASECGFTDQAHFTRSFSRIVGTSPGKWRHGRRFNVED